MAEAVVSAESQPDVVAAPPAAVPDATPSIGSGFGAGGLAAALRSGALTPSSVLALQRMAGNQAIASVLARDNGAPAAAPAAAAPKANTSPAITIEVPEALTNPLKVEGKALYCKGSLNLKGEVQFVPVETGVDPGGTTVGVNTGSQGAKVEIEREANKDVVAFLTSIGFEKVEETLTFEAGGKKLEASIGLAAKAKTKYDWCKGLVEAKFVGLGVEWDKINETTVGAIEVSGGFTGEGKVTLGGIDYIAKPKITLTGKVEPDWPRIGAKVAELVGREGGKGAVQAVATEAGATVLVMDGAAVTSAVAAIAIPVAAAVVMGYGIFQGMKNAKTGAEASGLGVVLRDKANEWAKNYARALTSHSAKGEGAADAEAQIAEVMAKTKAPREFVILKISTERGGYDKLREEALAKIKPRLYDEAVQAYEEGHKQEFGLVESLGPTWGTRGVFRKDLERVLMSDTAVGGG